MTIRYKVLEAGGLGKKWPCMTKREGRGKTQKSCHDKRGGGGPDTPKLAACYWWKAPMTQKNSYCKFVDV